MSLETKISLRIDWSELDTFGHINNVMIMKFIQIVTKKLQPLQKMYW